MKPSLSKIQLVGSILLFISTFFISSQANAISEFIKQQSAGQTVSLIYILIGIICILIIVPLLLLYTSAVRAKKYRKRTSEHYRILDARSTGIMCVDEQGVIESANQTSAALIDISQEKLLGSPLASYFDDEFLKSIHSGLMGKEISIRPKIRITQQYIDLEFGESFKQGEKSYRMLSLIGENAEGLSASFASKAEETSDTCEQLLSNTEQKLQSLLNDSPVALGTLNREHEIISANTVFIERLKFSEDELRKGNFYKLFSDPAQAEKMANLLNTDNQLEGFYAKLVGKDGEIYPAEITIKPIANNHEEYFLWMINRSDEQFQRDKFDLLLENDSSPICILTEQGFKRTNKAAFGFLGIKDERALKGLYPYSLELNENETKSRELYDIIETVKAQKMTKVLPWNHRVNGVLIPTELTLSPVYKDHKLDSIVCIWTDYREINALINTFKVLKKAHDHITNELAETTNNLEASHYQLQNKSDVLLDAEYEINILQQQVQINQITTEKLQKSLEVMENSKSSLYDENKNLNAQLIDTKEEAARLNETYNLTREKLNTSQTALTASSTRLADIKEQLQQTESLAQERLDNVNDLKSYVNEINEEIVKKDQQLSSLNELVKQVYEEKEQKEAVQTKANTLNDEYQLAKKQLQISEIALQESTRVVEQEKQINSENVKILDALSSEVDELKDTNYSLKQQLAVNNQSLNSKQGEIATLRMSFEESLENIRIDNETLRQEVEDNNQRQKYVEEESQKENDMLREQIAFKKQSEEDIEQRLSKSQKAREVLTKKLNALEQQIHSGSDNNKYISYNPKALSYDIELPHRIELWFDLSKFWQELPPEATLADSLSDLVEQIEDHIHQADKVIDEENIAGIVAISVKLLRLSKIIHSPPLSDLLQSFYNDCRLQMIDNALIRWTPTKLALQKSGRVVYGYLTRV